MRWVRDVERLGTAGATRAENAREPDVRGCRAECWPGRWPRVTWWMGGVGTYHVRVRLLGPDGNEIAAGESVLNAVTEPNTAAQMTYFPGLALPKPGKHLIEVSLDGAAVHIHVLHVIELQSAVQKEVKGYG